MGEAVAFYIIATLILGFGVLVVSARTPVYSVVFLVLSFLAVAGLYVLLSAQFLAVIQVLVYAGGIVVLYLFVVMLVRRQTSTSPHADPRRLGRLGGILAVAVLAELLAIIAYGWTKPDAAVSGGLQADNVKQLGWALYTDYLIPFEIASMLLLVAMLGAIVLAKRES